MQGPGNSVGALNITTLLKLSRCELDLLRESSGITRKRPNYKIVSAPKIIKNNSSGFLSHKWIVDYCNLSVLVMQEHILIEKFCRFCILLGGCCAKGFPEMQNLYEWILKPRIARAFALLLFVRLSSCFNAFLC